MSLFRVRPLGCRENLVAFELYRERLPSSMDESDVREEFTLWDPLGGPHKAYPDTPIEQAMTGRELVRLQAARWADHAALTRRLFGSSPVSGTPRPDMPIRGVIAFPVEIWSEQGRWMLEHRSGPRWYFSPGQLRDGLPRALPPARET
jgi:hypothetical protein